MSSGVGSSAASNVDKGQTFQNSSGDTWSAGAIRCSAADIIVRDSTFIGNDAISASDTGTGGAIAVATDGATLLVEGCHFEDNEAGTVGGASYTGPVYTSLNPRNRPSTRMPASA